MNTSTPVICSSNKFRKTKSGHRNNIFPFRNLTKNITKNNQKLCFAKSCTQKKISGFNFSQNQRPKIDTFILSIQIIKHRHKKHKFFIVSKSLLLGRSTVWKFWNCSMWMETFLIDKTLTGIEKQLAILLYISHLHNPAPAASVTWKARLFPKDQSGMRTSGTQVPVQESLEACIWHCSLWQENQSNFSFSQRNKHIQDIEKWGVMRNIGPFLKT